MNHNFNKPRLITVAVDVQNDFCPEGALAVTQGDAVVPPLNKIMGMTRTDDGLVISTRDWHPEETPHFEKWPTHCVANSSGAAFHPELDIRPSDTVISKGMGQTDGYSGFEGETVDGTTLADIIEYETRERRVAVIIGGLATDYCVLNTALDAAAIQTTNNNLRVFAVTDAMRAVNLQPQDGDEAINKMKDAGITIATSDDITRKNYISEAWS